jgi:eukaryotic-like serine/threonine-protein kinase
VIKDANGAGPEEKLAQSGRSLQVTDWSRDGRRLLFSYLDDTQGQRSDLWVLPLDGERKAQRITGAPAGAIHGQLSSDGKWLAYASKESGRFEVYVRAFPAGAQRWQVSSDGGNFPHWRRDGKELFYVGRSSKLTAVSVKTGASTLEFEAPHAMFPLPILYASLYAYDVSADGQRFLAIIPSAKAERDTMTAIINWQAALKR